MIEDFKLRFLKEILAELFIKQEFISLIDILGIDIIIVMFISNRVGK